MTPDSNAILTLSECAEWLQLSEDQVRENSKGSNPVIPCMRINKRVFRYHVGTILQKFGPAAGVQAIVGPKRQGYSIPHSVTTPAVTGARTAAPANQFGTASAKQAVNAVAGFSTPRPARAVSAVIPTPAATAAAGT